MRLLNSLSAGHDEGTLCVTYWLSARGDNIITVCRHRRKGYKSSQNTDIIFSLFVGDQQTKVDTATIRHCIFFLFNYNQYHHLHHRLSWSCSGSASDS